LKQIFLLFREMNRRYLLKKERGKVFLETIHEIRKTREEIETVKEETKVN